MLKLLSYIRFPIAGILALFCTAALSTAMVLVSFFHRREWEQVVLRLWGGSHLLLFNIKPVITGLENLPTEGVLFVFNHSSHFDILLIHGVTPKICRFGAKIELFKIPLFSHAMRAAGALPIARSNRSEVFKVYKEAQSRFANGESFILAPEGTRQTKPEIGKFKQGPFIFAVNAQVAVVPVVIEGALDIMRKGSFLVNWGVWRRYVQISYLPPMRPQQWSVDEVPQFQNAVRDAMVQEFARLRDKRNQLAPDAKPAT